jgi:anti-sigma B factor antagonist
MPFQRGLMPEKAVQVPRPSPPLQLHTSISPEATVVNCKGHLTFDVSEMFKGEVKKLIPNAQRIVLDLTELDYLDSSGLGAIVSIYVSSKRAGCELRLINFNKRVRELLGITHVLSIFESIGQYNIKLP